MALRRLAQLVPLLLAITFLSFAMMRLAGSDAVLQRMDNTGAVLSQEVIDAARAELGLDRPFLEQYVRWLGGVLHGDMGTSYVSGRDVSAAFAAKLPATLLLTAVSSGLRWRSRCRWGCWRRCAAADRWTGCCGPPALRAAACPIFLWRFC